MTGGAHKGRRRRLNRRALHTRGERGGLGWAAERAQEAWGFSFFYFFPILAKIHH
jgi:hypothetical protein